MSLKKINPRTTVLVLFILLAALFRLLNTSSIFFSLANFTPIGAMAIFGGAYLHTRWKRYLFPLLTLFISDVILMKIMYPGSTHGLLYSGWYWIYGAFASMVWTGEYIKKVSFRSVFMAAVAAALIHWIITDFGVWINGGVDITTGQPFTHDLQGFIQCYVLAIPFMKNMLIGNILYSGILFGGFNYLQNRYPVLQVNYA